MPLGGEFMYVIYADEIFLKNLIIDYVLLIVTARISGIRVGRWRVLIAAAGGGLYGVAASIWGSGFLDHPLMKLAAGTVLVLAVFGSSGRLLRVLLVFFGVSAAFAGAVIAAAGGASGEVSLSLLFFSFLLSCGLFTFAFRTIGRRRVSDEIVDVEISLSGRTVRASALVDTGNALRDPLTGCGVTVCSLEAVSPLFDARVRGIISTRLDAPRTLSLLGEAGIYSFFLVPYSSVGGEGLMLAFRPERVLVGGKEVKCAVAIAPDGFLRAAGHSAIVGAV